MTIHPPVISVVGLGAAIMPLVSCGRCLQPPCPPPIAITIEVTAAATGSPISNAFLTVSGPTVSTGPCGPTCSVPGTAGTYTLDVGAPGFETAHRSVMVPGTDPSDCGCPTVVTQRLAVALVSSP